MWETVWSRDQAEYDQLMMIMQALIAEANGSEGLPPITPELVKEGAKKIKSDAALGCDLFDVWMLKSVDGWVLENWAMLLNNVEKAMTWPMHILLNIVVLMGKPAGGVRPIALMPMLYRLWTKIRKPFLAEWEEINRGPWDAAVKGSSALRAAILSLFSDEVASLTEYEILKILWDMEIYMTTLTLNYW